MKVYYHFVTVTNLLPLFAFRIRSTCSANCASSANGSWPGRGRRRTWCPSCYDGCFDFFDCSRFVCTI